MSLKEIAEKVGVSVTTVSRVLNQDDTFSVSQEKKENIFKCAEEIGYHSTKKKKGEKKLTVHKKIGYVLTITKEKFEDSCFSTIIHGIEQEALARNCRIAFAYSVADLDNDTIRNNLFASDADGLIMIGNMPDDLYRSFTENFPCIVSIFDSMDDNPVDYVTVEYEKPFYQLTKNLIESGKSKIAFIGGETYKSSIEEKPMFEGRDERFQGYLKALIDHGITINPNIIRNAHWDIETAYTIMCQLLDGEEEIDAVEAAGDKMALGVMRAIQERGLKIPADIAVTGFDNIETTNYITPRLTTVDYPKEELGKEAVKLLLERINGVASPSRKKIVFPTEIIERDSI